MSKSPTCVPFDSRRLTTPFLALALEVAKFRTSGRVPVFCWKSPFNFASICRSSQPTPGPTGKRNHSDEEWLRALLVPISCLAGACIYAICVISTTCICHTAGTILHRRAHTTCMFSLDRGSYGAEMTIAIEIRACDTHNMKGMFVDRPSCRTRAPRNCESSPSWLPCMQNTNTEEQLVVIDCRPKMNAQAMLPALHKFKALLSHIECAIVQHMYLITYPSPLTCLILSPSPLTGF